MRRWLLLLPLLLAVGCSRIQGGDTPATSTTQPAGASTTSAAATPTSVGLGPSFQVPITVDLAYVQRLLDTIYHFDGEAARHAFVKRTPDAELDERLEAIFGEPALSDARRVISDNAIDGFAHFANPPGDPAVRVAEIVQVTPTCMIVRANVDDRPRFKDQRPAPAPSVLQLATADVLPLNPTGWGVAFAGVPDAGQDIRACP